jgi:cold shock CspA family protein
MDDMIAYVDEFGNLSSVPPDLTKRAVINAEDIDISGYKSKEADPAESIRNGIVTYFNDSKGYGFIRDLETRESVFVHINVLTSLWQKVTGHLRLKKDQRINQQMCNKQAC